MAQDLCAKTPGRAADASGMGRKAVAVTEFPTGTDGAPGKAIPGATITITGPDGKKTTYTAGSDGCISFPARLGEQYRLTATAPGYGRSIQNWDYNFPIDNDILLAELPAAGMVSNGNGGGLPVKDDGAPDQALGSAPTDQGPTDQGATSQGATGSEPASQTQAGQESPSGQNAQPGAADDGFGANRGTPPGTPPASFRSQLAKILLDLFLTLLAPLAYLGLQEITIRTMARGMMKKGAAAAAGNRGAIAVEELTRSTMYYPSLASIAAVPELEFAEMDSTEPIRLSGAAAARLARVRFTERRKFFLLLLSFVAQACGVGAIALLIWQTSKNTDSNPIGMLIALGVVVGADLLVVWWTWTIYLAGKRVMELIAVLACVGISVLSVIAMANGLPFYEALIPAIVQIFVLGWGWRRMRKAALGDGNRKLVILRVFGSDKNTAAVFGPLMSGWRFAGSFLTIADPAFLRYQFSVFSRANATKSLGVTLAIATFAALINHLAWILQELNVSHVNWFLHLSDQQRNSVVYALLSVLAVGPLIVYVRRRFLTAPRQAVEKVEQVRGSSLGVESDYPGSAFYCYDDVWKPAVRKMLDVADVLLMDLRGFSAERQGCAYEIGLLMDRFSVDRLLFLIDKTTPKELLYGLIRQRWSVMDLDSPNRKAARGLIKVFATGAKTQRDNKQIQAILSASVDGRLALEGGKISYLPKSGRESEHLADLVSQPDTIAIHRI